MRLFPAILGLQHSVQTDPTNLFQATQIYLVSFRLTLTSVQTNGRMSGFSFDEISLQLDGAVRKA
ncbi:MAG: hypothetical protein ACI92B_002642, partial [Marinobacter maritimus]